MTLEQFDSNEQAKIRKAKQVPKWITEEFGTLFEIINETLYLINPAPIVLGWLMNLFNRKFKASMRC